MNSHIRDNIKYFDRTIDDSIITHNLNLKLNNQLVLKNIVIDDTTNIFNFMFNDEKIQLVCENFEFYHDKAIINKIGYSIYNDFFAPICAVICYNHGSSKCYHSSIEINTILINKILNNSILCSLVLEEIALYEQYIIIEKPKYNFWQNEDIRLLKNEINLKIHETFRI